MMSNMNYANATLYLDASVFTSTLQEVQGQHYHSSLHDLSHDSFFHDHDEISSFQVPRWILTLLLIWMTNPCTAWSTLARCTRTHIRAWPANRVLRQNRPCCTRYSRFESLIEFWCIRVRREIEKFIIRQPPMGEKDDYDSENSWISDGLPSSSRRMDKIEGRRVVWI